MGPGPKVTRRLSVGHPGGPTANKKYYYENQIKKPAYPVCSHYIVPPFIAEAGIDTDKTNILYNGRHNKTNFLKCQLYNADAEEIGYKSI